MPKGLAVVKDLRGALGAELQGLAEIEGLLLAREALEAGDGVGVAAQDMLDRGAQGGVQLRGSVDAAIERYRSFRFAISSSLTSAMESSELSGTSS